MIHRLAFIFLLLAGVPLPSAGAQAPPGTPAAGGVALSGKQWESVLGQFEDAVLSSAQWLRQTKAEEAELLRDIDALEGKIAALRKNGNPDVISEIRLKGLLNELRDKLERNSDLRRQWEKREKDFEQKALSLVALYNDRIQAELEAPSGDAKSLDAKLLRLSLLIQKRSRTESLLREYRTKDTSEHLPPVPSFRRFQTGDQENLQLTLDLFQDRKKELEERLEKRTLEEDEIRNELKLQVKMQEFVQDIQRMNEDVDFPRGSLKRDDLEEMVGPNQKSRLEGRLQALRKGVARDRENLAQVEQLIDRVQHQLGSLKGGGGK